MALIFFSRDLVIKIYQNIYVLYLKKHLGKKKLKIIILTHCIDLNGVIELLILLKSIFLGNFYFNQKITTLLIFYIFFQKY